MFVFNPNYTGNMSESQSNSGVRQNCETLFEKKIIKPENGWWQDSNGRACG
jgi:hypothetical protein